MITATIREQKIDCLFRFHPWVFSGAIARFDGTPKEGEVVRIVDSHGQFLAVGHYQAGSIMIRILSFQDEPVDRCFFRQRLSEAYCLRQALGLITPDNSTYRLVHGEGDHLSGLVIDIYDSTAIIQAHSVGMHEARTLLAELVVELVDGVKHVYYKSDSTLSHKTEITLKEGYLIGNATDALAMENGLTFYVDWLRGQKTGFFIDQRDNRALLERYAEGRRVLNLFCYTGGFSLYAMRGKAALVHSIDSSGKAVELAKRNVSHNFGDDPRHSAFVEDAFKFLDGKKDQYDLIIVDPPAFAKRHDVLRNALQGYRRLNAKAFEQIAPGGLLFTFSCSQVVSREQFRLTVFSAAAASKRRVRILHQLTQPSDHPINIYHPEGEYLKGLVLYVE
jgi:23S rRNA (cytosine1962-C5)-methyltransferase